jgi:hypothetical protein
MPSNRWPVLLRCGRLHDPDAESALRRGSTSVCPERGIERPALLAAALPDVLLDKLDKPG